MNFIERVDIELKREKIRKSDLARGTQIADSTIRSYFDGCSPNLEAAIKIANFLNQSLDYLATGKASKDFVMSQEERELVLQFRRLDDRDKNAITTLCESLLSQYSDSTKRTITVG
jgi:transcriptional regulator with XRE-family HTH domain